MIHKFTMKQWQAATLSVEPHTFEWKQLNGPSPGGLARRLGLSRNTIYAMVNRGTLDAIKVIEEGEMIMYMVTEASVDEYLVRRKRREANKAAKTTKPSKPAKRAG